MKSPALKFILYVIALAAACIALQTIVYNKLGDGAKLHSGLLLLGIFAFCTAGIHLVLLNSTKGSPQAFIRAFMGATMGRFLLYLSVLVVFLMFTQENSKVLAVHFLFYYAVFTILEVSMIYSEIRKMK